MGRVGARIDTRHWNYFLVAAKNVLDRLRRQRQLGRLTHIEYEILNQEKSKAA
jgi:hypothetical protein